MRFNSIKVRLEQMGYKPLFSTPMFQFHKGTIRTLAHGGDTSVCMTFQFHKGTIRTSREMNVSKTKICFNSIKVRLEQPVQYSRLCTYRVSIP